MPDLTLTICRPDGSAASRWARIPADRIQPLRALVRGLAHAAEPLPAQDARWVAVVVPTLGVPVVLVKRVPVARLGELEALVNAAETVGAERERQVRERVAALAERQRADDLALESIVLATQLRMADKAFGELRERYDAAEAACARWQERAEEAEGQRDEAFAALTRHAAEAHRRKWRHDGDNQAAFDALHRIGGEILASRDRLLAALDQPETTP